ncbi:MAG: hypothetical protein LUD27_07500 [Clostridia bacterium]|nr:hypothetical protein [Clostridia bacterium]
MLITKVDFKEGVNLFTPTAKPLNEQTPQRKLKQMLERVDISDDCVNNYVKGNNSLQLTLAEANFNPQGVYAYAVKPDDFLTAGAVLLRLFESISCWQCTFNGADVWQFNIQNPTDYGQAVLSGVKNSLSDRLYKNKGRAPQSESGMFLCKPQEGDFESADKSDFTAGLLADQLFYTAELSSLTLEQAKTDSFVLAAVCAKKRVYLHSGNFPDEDHTPFLHIGLN